ncbi:MAG TPA: ABC transporter permease [Gemmatimonadaceae bacterium]|nr:ABC transporter permease [Gemmatimonadaceae bacterium]
MRIFDRVTMAFEGVGMALDAMRANKVRAALTISGVAVGVFVVVVMGAVVHGIGESFEKDLDEFGAMTFQVRRRGISVGGCDGTDENCPDRRNPRILLGEWEMIRRLPEVQTATAWIFGGAPMAYRDKFLRGVGFDAQSDDWIQTDQADISPGRSFTRTEHDAGAMVMLVNDSLKSQLFGDSDPIGKEVDVDGRKITVIGVFHTKAGFLKTMDGRGPDQPRAILPMMTAWRHLNVWRSLLIMVKPRADVPQDVAMDAVMAAMRSYRGLRPAQPNNFALVTQDRMLDVFNQLFGVIFLVGLGLSAVGLLVGGVGVVAIMMISVTERTREIGVRKALGATRGIILWQFLVEAATMTTLGAAIGLVIGQVLAWVVRANSPIPASITVSAIALSLASAALTGIAFGLMPAARAARMDPVEALRYE